MKNKQKAQGIVEFALILPLFLLFFMGIAYFGFLFSDYLTLHSVVRSVAYDAATKTSTQSFAKSIQDHAENVSLPSDILIWEPKDAGNPPYNNKYISLAYDPEKKNVVATATADFNPKSSLGNFMNNVLKGENGKLPQVKITYIMYAPNIKSEDNQ